MPCGKSGHVLLASGRQGHPPQAAAGRVPNIADLGLEAAGVAFTEKGVTVNEHDPFTQKYIFPGSSLPRLSEQAAQLSARLGEQLIPAAGMAHVGHAELGRVGLGHGGAQRIGRRSAELFRRTVQARQPEGDRDAAAKRL